MRVAVLGSNSFAAGDLIELLLESRRYEVLGISRSPESPPPFSAYASHRDGAFTFRRLDLNRELERIRTTLDGFTPDWIVNFAAEGDDTASWERPQDFLLTNCVALGGLLAGLRGAAYLRRFLQVSSSSVYGNAPSLNTEGTPLAPSSPYGTSKAAADLLLLAYHKTFGFPAEIIRPPNLYGPHQNLLRLIPKTIVSLMRGDAIELHGGGSARRSYLHVRDASRAMLAILERGTPGEVYNVAPDCEVSVREIVTAICELLGEDFDASTRNVADRRGQQNGLRLDSSKIRNELNWSPQISLSVGIASVRDWIERDWEQLVQQPGRA